MNFTSFWLILTLLVSFTFPFFALISPKVVVIGGGLAGLTTAYRLQRLGINVELFEAKKRVGGRIFTVLINGKIGELGGLNILDGGSATNILQLIQELKLEVLEGEVLMNANYFSEGKVVNLPEMMKEYTFDPESLNTTLKAIAKQSNNMRDVLKTLFQNNEVLFKIVSHRLSSYEGDSPEKLSPKYIETLYHILMGGLSHAHQGQGTQKTYVNFITLKEGNSQLTELLANKMGNTIHLNMPLKSISKTVENSYVLTFNNQEQVTADIIVLAIPCPVYNDINFTNDIIPKDVLASIQNIHYGTNAKILVPCLSEYATAKISTTTSIMNERIVTFFNPNRDVLTLYFTGEAGEFNAHSIAENSRQDLIFLKSFFGPKFLSDKMPVMANDGSFVSYSTPVGHNWVNDPYAKGSYSYVAPGQEVVMTDQQESNGELVTSIYAPIDNTLFFAGEHASILLDVRGTMEAACESGERTARMIANTIL